MQRFAHDPALSHRPAWQAFNELVRHDSDTIGLWHELCVIAPSTTTSLYRNMPRTGLGLATGHRPASHNPTATHIGATVPPIAHHATMLT